MQACLPFLDSDDGYVCPSVRHLNEGACRFRPNAIYVGSVSEVVDISPWSMPLPCANFADNADFLRARADLRVLLWHLQNKVLVCDCLSYLSHCWGMFLVDVICEVFQITQDMDDNKCTSDESEGSEETVEADGEETDQYDADRILCRQQDLAAGGRQRPRHRPRQLLPDGLKPEEHLRGALCLKHQFVGELASTPRG